MEPEESRNFKERVGARLREIRGPRPQAHFADRLDVLQQTLSNYENGVVPSSWEFLARLREAEGIDLNNLLAIPATVEV